MTAFEEFLASGEAAGLTPDALEHLRRWPFRGEPEASDYAAVAAVIKRVDRRSGVHQIRL